MHDLRVSPLSNMYPGVEILATAIDNLKNQRMMRAAPGWFAPAFALILLTLLYALFWRRINAIRVGASPSVLTLLMLGASHVMVGQLYILPVLSQLLLCWGYYFVCALQGINLQDSGLALMFKTHPTFTHRLDLLDKLMSGSFDSFESQPSLASRFFAAMGIAEAASAPEETARVKPKFIA